MNKDLLIQQVKDEYARLAELENQAHFTNQSYHNMSPESYYEKALEKAIRDITAGKYDDCMTGTEVVERIANNKTKAKKIQDTIESTLHNMEVAEEIIASETNHRKAQELKSANERRADAIPEMIREMKEEQAKEELNHDSPNIVGGGGNG